MASPDSNLQQTLTSETPTSPTYDPRRQMGVSVYRAEEKVFSVGDRIQFTAPNQELKIANRELASIGNISANDSMHLKLDSGRNVEVGVHGFPHIDHGYAVTSHSSQGQTAERVLIHADTELGAKDLLNHRMAYVSVSRGQWDAQIFTNDRDKLVQALSHDVSHKSALQPEQVIAGAHKIGPASERLIERSVGYGLGL